MDLTNFNEFIVFHSNIIGGAGQTQKEAFNLCNYLEKTNLLDGDVVEVGVWNGGSAQILKNYKNKQKKLFLFDTFKGLQDCTDEEDGNLKNGMMAYNFNYVKELFKNDDSIIVTEGYFPESAINLLPDKISFIHIDVDTYQSTLNGLKFIYNKIVKNGIIIIHDYINNPDTIGVNKAVNEFLIDKKENIIIPDNTTQGVIVKV